MTTFGWDMSHYDAPSIGNAVAEGISFVTHKAGGDGNDTELPTWWSGVKNLDPSKVLLGAYWVLYPGSPSARADTFLARLDAVCDGWRDRPFLLQVDCEKWNGDPGTVPSEADISAFCDRLVQKMPKLRPVVYAPKWVYGNSLAGLSYPLWASAYVTGSGPFKALYPGDSSSRWTVYSGQTPEVLQYTSSATIGGQTLSDANAYRGTLQELTALVAPGWTDAVNSTDVNVLFNTDGVITSPSGANSADPSWTGGQFFRNTYNEAKSAHLAVGDVLSQLETLQAAVTALGQPPAVDVPALAAGIVALLPALGGGLTQADVEAAVRTVLHGA